MTLIFRILRTIPVIKRIDDVRVNASNEYAHYAINESLIS